jgi:FkbM family methyltransferase
MLSAAIHALKKHAPGVHGFIKRAYFRSRFPAFKLLNGKFTLVAPQLVNAFPTEPHVLRWIEQSLRPGNTFFDVGAHHGWMSLLACRCVGPEGKVVAFEPSPPLVEILQYNNRANRFAHMEIVAKAVANSDGRMAPLYVANQGNSFQNSLIDHPFGSSEMATMKKSTIQVETISLDEFCRTANLKPDVAKIDIEGAELLALQGCGRILKEHRARFIVAIHPIWLPAGQNAGQIFDLFRLHGYSVADSLTVRYEGADFGDYLFVPGSL